MTQNQLSQIQSLETEALQLADWRGHTITDMHRYNPDRNTIKSSGRCDDCGAILIVSTNPAPGLDKVSGDAITAHCDPQPKQKAAPLSLEGKTTSPTATEPQALSQTEPETVTETITITKYVSLPKPQPCANEKFLSTVTTIWAGILIFAGLIATFAIILLASK